MDGVVGLLIVAAMVLVGWALWLWRSLVGARERNQFMVADHEHERDAEAHRQQAQRIHELAIIAAKKEVESAALADLQNQVRALQATVTAASWKGK